MNVWLDYIIIQQIQTCFGQRGERNTVFLTQTHAHEDESPVVYIWAVIRLEIWELIASTNGY